MNHVGIVGYRSRVPIEAGSLIQAGGFY